MKKFSRVCARIDFGAIDSNLQLMKDKPADLIKPVVILDNQP